MTKHLIRPPGWEGRRFSCSLGGEADCTRAVVVTFIRSRHARGTVERALGALSARDLRAGQVHKGPIIAVESWGVLVQLGDDAKALVTNMHLADASVKDARSRFRVGAKVTCKLLTVEKGGRRVRLGVGCNRGNSVNFPKLIDKFNPNIEYYMNTK